MTGELVRREDWEPKAAQLVEAYAGFSDARTLSDEEKIISLVSIIPMALEVVEEARDTIERLNDENSQLLSELEELRWRMEGLEK